MKRFLSLLALVASPAFGFAADAQMAKSTTAADKMKDCCSCGPVSAMDECWAARTNLTVGFDKTKSASYSLNTIQPLYRDASMDNTVFVQAGLGLKKWHRSTGDIGLGYRHLLASGEHMFGVSLFYFDNTRVHRASSHLVKKNGLGADLSWFTQYTTLSFGRYQNVYRKFNSGRTWKRFADLNKAVTTLDLNFRVPFMPWAEITVGKAWFHHHHGLKKSLKKSFKKLDYALKLNVAGPLAIEAGYRSGWNHSGFVNFVISFGRPAVREATLVEGFLADEAFTPRDLKNYTLDTVSRALI